MPEAMLTGQPCEHSAPFSKLEMLHRMFNEHTCADDCAHDDSDAAATARAWDRAGRGCALRHLHTRSYGCGGTELGVAQQIPVGGGARRDSCLGLAA